MKRATLSIFVCLLLVSGAWAQESSSIGLSLHSNTGSPLMLGVSYRFSESIAVRASAGYTPTSGSYDRATTTAAGVTSGRYKTHWYGGALAGLYYLPSAWRLAPYAGATLQYVYASDRGENASRRLTGDRVDVGGILGMEVRLLKWLRIFGEAGLGYRSGLPANSGSLESLRLRTGSEFGLIHGGLGLQMRIY